MFNVEFKKIDSENDMRIPGGGGGGDSGLSYPDVCMGVENRPILKGLTDGNSYPY